MPLKHSELIYDWNNVPGAEFKPAGRVLLNDESLRDGLQSPSVKDPAIEKKIEILHLMESLGINSLNLGLPGAGPRAFRHAMQSRPGLVVGFAHGAPGGRNEVAAVILDEIFAA